MSLLFALCVVCGLLSNVFMLYWLISSRLEDRRRYKRWLADLATTKRLAGIE